MTKKKILIGISGKPDDYWTTVYYRLEDDPLEYCCDIDAWNQYLAEEKLIDGGADPKLVQDLIDAVIAVTDRDRAMEEAGESL